MSKIPMSPGPWSFGYTDDLKVPVILDAAGDVVCAMHEGVTAIDGKAMSAAPDLLEFAQEWLSRQGGDDNYMTAKARAAIAKATGGAA